MDDTTPEEPDEPNPRTDSRAGEGLDHLQAAAREMIAAARAFLDVVEEMVDDRDAVSSVVDAVSSAAQGAARAVRQGGVTGTAPGRDDPPDGGVQHIRVS